MNKQDLPSNTVPQAVATAGAGATFTAAAAQPCLYVRVHAPITAAIDVQIAGVFLATIAAGGARSFFGVSDTKNISVRRNDQSNTTVNVGVEGFQQ